MTDFADSLTFEFPQMQPQQRLRELILHIAKASRFNQNFSKTKLVKLLYFADFTAFRLHGEPITGSKYVKLPNGPIPDEFDALISEMVAEGDIRIEEERFPGYSYPRLRMIAFREPNYSLFSARQIALIDDLIRTHWEDDGTTLIDTSRVVWERLKALEAIPYEASIVSVEEVTQQDIADAQELVKKHGWDV